MSSPPSRFEFGELDNQQFTRLATVMQLVAIAIAVVAVQVGMYVTPGLLDDLRTADLVELFARIAQVLVPLAIALWTFRAGSHLRRVVRTQGDDIQHLMRAISALSRLYILQFLLALALIAAFSSMWMGRSALEWIGHFH